MTAVAVVAVGTSSMKPMTFDCAETCVSVCEANSENNDHLDAEMRKFHSILKRKKFDIFPRSRIHRCTTLYVYFVYVYELNR